jgi:hypothetical protein
MSLRMTRTSEFGTNRTCQPPRLMSAHGANVLQNSLLGSERAIIESN